MRKISGKAYKPNNDNGFSNDISSLFRGNLFKTKMKYHC